MPATKSWPSLWLTKMLGLLLLAAGCATTVIAPEPYRCPHLTDEILDEYEAIKIVPKTDSLRAWIREADKACRANEQLLKETQ